MIHCCCVAQHIMPLWGKIIIWTLMGTTIILFVLAIRYINKVVKDV